MSAVPFDTLKLARALRERGSMSPEQAEGVTVALAEAFDGEIASKRDLAEAEGGIQHELRQVRQEVKDLEARLTARMELLARDQTIKLGGMLVVAVGAVATLTKLF